MSEALLARLGALAGATTVETRSDGLWMIAPELDVQALARLMVELGGRLSTMTGKALAGGETAVIYHYFLGGQPHGQPVNLEVHTHGNALPSITPITLAADWIEREIHDLYAVDFPGHPNLARLVRPPQLEPGFFR